MSGPGTEHATLLLRDTGASNGIAASGRNASKQFLVELTDAASIFDESGARAAALRLSVRRWRTPQAAVKRSLRSGHGRSSRFWWWTRFVLINLG